MTTVTDTKATQRTLTLPQIRHIFFIFSFSFLDYLFMLSALQNPDDKRWIKVHQASKYFFLSVECCLALSKQIAPFLFLFLTKCWILIIFQTWEKLTITRFMTESERAWVYSWFDVINYFAFMITTIECKANQFVTSNQEWTHAGRETIDAKYCLRFMPVKSQNFV